MITELWTDGSGTREGPIGWAYVLRAVDPAGELLSEQVGLGACDEGTNNRAELSAVLAGLRALSLPATVRLFTDSEYVAKAFSEGYLATWRRNGWRKRGGGAVANVDLWRAIAGVAGPHNLTVQWVAGHTGIDLNERCDRLAGLARRLVKDELAPPEPAPREETTAV